MMREVLTRRFRRLMAEAPRPASGPQCEGSPLGFSEETPHPAPFGGTLSLK